jgi:YegS/Rv2252/BmrU family lipid kinase
MADTKLTKYDDQNPADLLKRMGAVQGGRFVPRKPPQRVHVIINPAAGKDQPVLKVLNGALQTAGVDWEILITKEAGDARRYAQEAARAGVDVVAVHGGDGTVMEVASGLIGSQVPFAIIPGGTANVMSVELGIPGDLVEACALVVNPDAAVRMVDMGQIEDHYFLLRAGMGFEAAMVEGADRELKDRLGVFAYAFSGLQALADPPLARYRLVLDGREVETEGLACIIANSGTMGVPGVPALTLSNKINVSDGLLDVMVVTRSDLPGIVSLVANFVAGSENPEALQLWQVREATINADPPQKVQVDGEILMETPVTARVLPEAVRAVVPAVVDA